MAYKFFMILFLEMKINVLLYALYVIYLFWRHNLKLLASKIQRISVALYIL